jgi:hypothetical protein
MRCLEGVDSRRMFIPACRPRSDHSARTVRPADRDPARIGPRAHRGPTRPDPSSQPKLSRAAPELPRARCPARFVSATTGRR